MLFSSFMIFGLTNTTEISSTQSRNAPCPWFNPLGTSRSPTLSLTKPFYNCHSQLLFSIVSPSYSSWCKRPMEVKQSNMLKSHGLQHPKERLQDSLARTSIHLGFLSFPFHCSSMPMLDLYWVVNWQFSQQCNSIILDIITSFKMFSNFNYWVCFILV